MTDNETRKADLRATLRRRRRSADAADRAAAGTAVARRLEGLLDGVELLAGFASHDNEIDLQELYEPWLASGKRLVFPRVIAEGDMVFAKVTSLDDLRPGHFGIAEPTGPAVNLASIEAFLVPAVAFDRRGGRLGFGGGYYDRVLQPFARADEKVPIVLGIGYSWQLLDEDLPSDSWDVPMPCIVTDTEVWTVPEQ